MAVERLCLLAILCALAVLLLRRVREEYATVLRVATAVLLGTALIPAAAAVFRYVRELSGLLPSAELYVQTLLKALGVAFLAQMCAGVCRDCGEGSLAMQLELLGGLLAFTEVLPLVTGVLALLRSLAGTA